MSFEIPLSARASLNRLHKEGVPALEPAGDRVEWRSFVAYWSREEKRMVAGMAASELAFLHELKARLDAVLVEGEEPGRDVGESPVVGGFLSAPVSPSPSTATRKKGPR